MDFLIWYGLFWYALGALMAFTFSWLWFKASKPTRRIPFWYNIHDEIDMMLDDRLEML